MAKVKSKYSKVKNLSLRIYNISKKTNAGKLYVVYSHMGKEKYFPTNVSLHSDKWDAQSKEPAHKALSATEISLVDELYDKIAKLIRDYQFKNDNVLPSIQYLEEHINKKEHPTDIHELYQQYLQTCEKKLAEGTITAYRIAGDLLKEVDKHYNHHLNLSNFNYSFIQRFVEYCQHVKENKNSNTTVSYRISIFKGFVTYLNKMEIKHGIKTDNWDVIDKAASASATLLCLERDELNQVLAHKPSGKREQKIKDIIVFLSHTGMRVSDSSKITLDHIKEDFIDYIPEKTKKRVKGGVRAVVPISKPVREVLKRYGGVPPYMDKSNVQKSIRKFCAKIPLLQENIRYIEVDGTEEKEVFVPKYSVLTSHAVGRKTFINLCIQAGVPIPTVMGMSGHLTMDTVIKSYLNKHQNSLPQLSKVFEF